MRVWAAATVNLPGLASGIAALVDPDRESTRGLIAAGYLRVCTLEESAELDRRTGRPQEETA